MTCLAIGRYQPGIFYLQKSYKIYKRKTNTSLNLTQLHIHIHNTNLKTNLYENSIFIFYLGHQKNRNTLNNFFLGLEYFCKYTHNKMSNQESEDVLYWRQEYWIAMQRWEMSSWVFCITLKIVALATQRNQLLNYWPLVIMNIELQHKGINF